MPMPDPEQHNKFKRGDLVVLKHDTVKSVCLAEDTTDIGFRKHIETVTKPGRPLPAGQTYAVILEAGVHAEWHREVNDAVHVWVVGHGAGFLFEHEVELA